MTPYLVRYTAKPERADENARLIAGVFRELHATQPDGLRYLVLRLADGSFIHMAVTGGNDETLTGLSSFQTFVAGADTRREAPPLRGEATIVGNYRMLAE